MRRPLLFLSVALLGVALYAASFSWWLEAEIVDSEAFVATTVEVLNQPDARDATAEIIVERLVEELPILGLLEGGLTKIFSDLLGTEELQGLLVLLGEELHGRMVTGDQSDFVLDLDPFRETLLTPLTALAPELVDLVPDSWFRSVSIVDGDVIPDIEPYVEVNRIVAVLAAGASILLILVTAMLARRWWTGLGLVGAAMTFAGGAAVLLVSAASSFVAGTISDESLKALTTSLYDGLTRSLVARSLLLVFAGLVLIGIGLLPWVVGNRQQMTDSRAQTAEHRQQSTDIR